MSVNSKMTALADEIRELSGTEETMGLDAMTNYVDEANTDVATEANLIEQIASALEGKAASGEQATPEISVSSNGLITATAGTKTSTHQLAFQSAKTITPSTTSQIAVSSGYYTGGNITVTGDSNLIADNIKSGISIFGVTGSYESSGEQAEWYANEDSIVSGTIQEYTNDRVTEVGDQVFFGYNKLISINFPKVQSIGNNAFRDCSKLTSVSFPEVTIIGSYAFQDCINLTSVSFPKAKSIGDGTFKGCYNLKSLYLTGSSLCTLSNSNAFNSTPIGGYSASAGTYGSIYVPASLLTSYQTATNWTYFSSRFVGI